MEICCSEAASPALLPAPLVAFEDQFSLSLEKHLFLPYQHVSIVKEDIAKRKESLTRQIRADVNSPIRVNSPEVSAAIASIDAITRTQTDGVLNSSSVFI